MQSLGVIFKHSVLSNKMFSAASCGLTLLSDEALSGGDAADAASSDGEYVSPSNSPGPKRRRTHNKRVSICSRDEIREFETESWEQQPINVFDLPSSSNNLLEYETSESEILYAFHIDRRLEQAEMHREWNKTPFRYRQFIDLPKNRGTQDHAAQSQECCSSEYDDSGTTEPASPDAGSRRRNLWTSPGDVGGGMGTDGDSCTLPFLKKFLSSGF